MFNQDYEAQLSLLDQQTLNLEVMLNKRETAGPEWHHIRAKVAVVRDCLRRIREINAGVQEERSPGLIDRLAYETQAMNRRFDELLATLETRVHDLEPAVVLGLFN